MNKRPSIKYKGGYLPLPSGAFVYMRADSSAFVDIGYDEHERFIIYRYPIHVIFSPWMKNATFDIALN